MKRKILAIIPIVMLIISLSACGRKETLYEIPDLSQYKTDYVGDSSNVINIVSKQDYPEGYSYDSIEIQSETKPYEYVAFLEMLTTKESTALLSQLKKIVMLGRQAGYFLIVACQRPDAKYFGDGIRDNFNFRVGLGRLSELGYGMLFGSDVKKQFFQKQIKGRGYCDVGTSVISEFYTPLVPKGYDFLGTIGELAERRTEKKALEQSEALL